MGFSLESIGMKEGGRYPIGVKCIGDEEIAARIFEGSTTLENIKETKVFCINITDNPMLYAQTLFKTYDESQFKKDDDIVFLKNTDAYGIALVTSIEEQTLENDQISTEGKAFIIKAEVLKIVVNRHLIERVGSEDIKESMSLLKDKMIEKGIEF